MNIFIIKFFNLVTMRKIIIACLILLSSCNKDDIINYLDSYTYYSYSVTNYSSDYLIVEYSTDTSEIKYKTIEQDKFLHTIFTFKKEANMPALDSQEFRSIFSVFNIYRVLGNDTILVNQDSNYYKNIKSWNYMYVWDDFTDGHDYYLGI